MRNGDYLSSIRIEESHQRKTLSSQNFYHINVSSFAAKRRDVNSTEERDKMWDVERRNRQELSIAGPQAD